jgi:hypothetical protein
MTWLKDFPSTNARIALTLLLAFGTGCRVIALGWDAPNDWLVFLTVWAGLDIVQFANKRMTHKGAVDAGVEQ